MKQEDFLIPLTISEKPLIEKVSPKLSSLLYKKFPTQIANIQEAFQIANKYGGCEELFFEREMGVSFNPRAARIPLIMEKFNKNCGLDLYLAGILSTINPKLITAKKLTAELYKLINKNTSKLIVEFFELETNLVSGSSNINTHAASTDSIFINLCSFIDRFRHAHQSGPLEIKNCLAIFDNYFKVIPSDLPKMAFTFETWHKRTQLQAKSINGSKR